MRLIPLVVAALVACATAAVAQSQGWKEYTYPQYSFGLSFPEEPKIETKPYQTADGSPADARIYSVARGNSEFVMTVVELSDKKTDEKTVIDHAIKSLAGDGEVKLDITHRISAVYGRQLSIAGRDGTHSSVAVFYYQKRLYQIAGIAHPGENATADAIRFQQSLIFTNNAANRTPLEPVFQVFGRVFGTNN
jgi:hypothetical protein